MKHEYERVDHHVVKNFKLFMVDLDYRTPHIHKDLEICFLLEGRVGVICGEQELMVDKDDFFVLNPFQPHELRAQGHARILSLQVPAGFCREYYPAMQGMEFSFCRAGDAMAQEHVRRIFGIARDLAAHYFAMDEHFELICTARVNELLYELIGRCPHETASEKTLRQNRLRYERARRIIHYVDAHYTRRLFLSEIAQRENLSLTYLSHFFKDCFQMSFQAYLQSVRCEKARQLLMMTRLNLLEISLECGFSDVKYLNKAFEQQYGCAPRSFRSRQGRQEQPLPSASLTSVQQILSREASLAAIAGKRLPAAGGKD